MVKTVSVDDVDVAAHVHLLVVLRETAPASWSEIVPSICEHVLGSGACWPIPSIDMVLLFVHMNSSVLALWRSLYPVVAGRDRLVADLLKLAAAAQRWRGASTCRSLVVIDPLIQGAVQRIMLGEAHDRLVLRWCHLVSLIVVVQVCVLPSHLELGLGYSGLVVVRPIVHVVLEASLEILALSWQLLLTCKHARMASSELVVLVLVLLHLLLARVWPHLAARWWIKLRRPLLDVVCSAHLEI